MDNVKVIRNCIVVPLLPMLMLAFSFNTYAQQPSDQRRLPQPLQQKLRGPQWLQQKLLAKKAQAEKTQPPAVAKQKCKNCDELLSKARKYGSVSIIVGLNIPDLPDATRLPHVPKEERRRIDQARKEAIAQAQERLLKRMAKHKIAYIKKSEYFPDMAMTIDAAALEALIADPEVRNIGENILMRPLLPQSVPLIGADQACASGFSGAGYATAILDTGVDSTHPFLAGKVVSEACFSTNNSGTDPVYGPWTETTLCPKSTTSQIDDV